MKDFSEFAPLSTAETRLLEDRAATTRITVGDGELPEADGDAVTIRAALLRQLLVTHEATLSEKGLRLRGARITGLLDLQGINIEHDITLSRCVLTDRIELVNARLNGLYISGCQMQGLSADSAHFDGSLFLRADTHVDGEISLAGAHVAGDMQLCDVEIDATGQDAIFAPSLSVGGSVFIGNYPYSSGVSEFRSTGGLFLSSLSVAHDVFVTNASIAPHPADATDSFFHATEEHGPDMALSLARARIGGILYFRDNQIARGIVNLAGAEVARLRDEPAEPGATYPIRLDGFRYQDFSRHTDTSIKSRLDWLDRRPTDTPFTAQPYEHLARVLRELGHRGDARKVLMHKEHLLRNEDRAGTSGLAKLAKIISDGVMRFAVGYGYRPGRILVLAVVLIVALGWFFDQTWKAGDMAPNAAPILVSRDWIAATETHPDNPGAFWAQADQAGKDWETFHPYAYAADLVIPIVSLGQESTWAPSTSRSDWGRAGWWMRWFAKALGWIITALGAAAVTGAVRQD